MVETIGMGEMNGYADSHADFVAAHELNTRALLNLADAEAQKAAGVPVTIKKNDPRPAYDPAHSDNHWPLMIHHAQKGEKVIGKSLKGLAGRSRLEQEQSNKKELEAHLDPKAGWRREPFPKPQVAVLDPATEKAHMLERNRMLEGLIVQQNDLVQKLSARLDALENGSAGDAGKPKG